jgi:hypothetical protein
MLFLHFSGTQTLAGIWVQKYEYYLNWSEFICFGPIFVTFFE